VFVELKLAVDPDEVMLVVPLEVVGGVEQWKVAWVEWVGLVLP
jgi:hypothetical protein